MQFWGVCVIKLPVYKHPPGCFSICAPSYLSGCRFLPLLSVLYFNLHVPHVSLPTYVAVILFLSSVLYVNLPVILFACPLYYMLCLPLSAVRPLLVKFTEVPSPQKNLAAVDLKTLVTYKCMLTIKFIVTLSLTALETGWTIRLMSDPH